MKKLFSLILIAFLFCSVSGLIAQTAAPCNVDVSVQSVNNGNYIFEYNVTGANVESVTWHLLDTMVITTALSDSFLFTVPNEQGTGSSAAFVTATTAHGSCTNLAYFIYNSVYPPNPYNISVWPINHVVGEQVNLQYNTNMGTAATTVDWGDGTVLTNMPSAATLHHIYSQPGYHDVSVTNGQTSTKQINTVAQLTPVTIISPGPGEIYSPGVWDTVTIYSPLNHSMLAFVRDETYAFGSGISAGTPLCVDGYIKKFPLNMPATAISNPRVIASLEGYNKYGIDTGGVFSLAGRVIKGNVFYDYNSNNILDNNEYVLQSPLFTINGAPATQQNAGNGNYLIYDITADTHTLSVANVPQYYSLSPSQYTLNMVDTALFTNKNFALQSTVSFYDLSISMHRSAPSATQISHVYITATNNGPAPSDSTVLRFLYNSALENVVGATPAPLLQPQGQVIFNLPSLYQGQSVQFLVETTMPVPVGTPMLESAGTGLMPNDININNNGLENTFFVVGAVDPNQITVITDTIYSDQTDTPPALHYLIEFQNTGTEPAVNIKVVDTLHTNLDWNTLQINHVSHNYFVNILPGGILEWYFNGILLPDSTTDEPASHGHIAYSIKPIANLPVGTVFNSVADIYFDYNAPIRTNFAPVWIAEPTGIKEDAAKFFSIFPNPANGMVYIQPTSAYQNDKLTLRIFAADGRLVREEVLQPKTQHAIDISKLANGIYNLTLTNGKAVAGQKVVKY